MSRTILTTDSAEFEARVRQATGALNGDLRRIGSEQLAADPVRMAAALGNEELLPDVIAIGPDVDEGRALLLAQAIDARYPDIAVVLVAPPLKSLLERAMRAGVRDVVAPDAPLEQLQDTFARAAESAARRRNALAAEGAADHHRVIAVLSPKGGAGKTMIATNLAVGLAQAQRDDVVLADYDLQFGDVASALRLAPERTINDVIGVTDPMLVKAALTHHPSGLYTLCAPDSPIDSEHISGEQAGKVAAVLASQFRTVVIDTSAGLTEHALAAVEVATDLLFVCTMDVPSVRSLRKVIVALDQIGMTTQQRHFVLNRAQTRVGLDEADIAATVGMPVDISLPSSRSVPLAMNQGVSVLESDPRSPATKQLRQLVNRFVPATSSTHGKSRGWRRS